MLNLLFLLSPSRIWDTVKGQVQTEFADITSDDANLYTKPDRGHLSVDYKCMKWLSLDSKVHDFFEFMQKSGFIIAVPSV